MIIELTEASLRDRIPAALVEAYPGDVRIVGTDQRSRNPGRRDPKTILVADNLGADSMLRAMMATGASHVVQERGSSFDLELELALRMATKPSAFLQDPVHAIMPEARARDGADFDSSDAKRDTIAALRQFLGTVDGASALMDDALLIADELFTNAIYNAPTDSTGKRRYARVPRSTAVKLSDGERNELLWAHDAHHVLLSCRDPFGSLDPGPMLDHVLKSYKVGPRSAMRLDPNGGAGLGFRLIVDRAISVHLLIQPGRSTWVGCMLSLGKRQSERDKTAKSIHILTHRKETRP